MALDFNTKVNIDKQKFIDSSNRVRTFVKNTLNFNLVELKKASDVLVATIAKYPFIRISNIAKSALLKILYTAFTTDAIEALNYVQSINIFSTDRGAIKNFDSTPPPYDVQLKTYCNDYQNAVWNHEDAYMANKTCASEQIANLPSILNLFQRHFQNLTDVETKTMNEITTITTGYMEAISASIAALSMENIRLRSCTANPVACVDALVS